MAGRLLAAIAPSFVFRHVGGRHGGARAQPLFGNAMQILVIEDDARVAEHIAKGLKKAGQGVALESDGRPGLLRPAADASDLTVVDRMLPPADSPPTDQTMPPTRHQPPVLAPGAPGEVLQ